MLYLSFRGEVDFPEVKQIPDVTEVVRVEKVRPFEIQELTIIECKRADSFGIPMVPGFLTLAGGRIYDHWRAQSIGPHLFEILPIG